MKSPVGRANRVADERRPWAVAALWMVLAVLSGCRGPELTTPDGYEAFVNAGPQPVRIDREALIAARQVEDRYRVVAGDVLELEMEPVLIDRAPGSLDGVTVWRGRVDDRGAIELPVVGMVRVAGLDLAQIEKRVAGAFYPEFVPGPPSILARVAEYATQAVTIAGAVAHPGRYRLQSDELSLVALLMKAGGIEREEGAAAIRIWRGEGGAEPEPMLLPVRGLTIPFADVALARGDRVEVERLRPEVFTVMGLVQRPGAFPYPPEGRFTVMQALAFAGGINPVADPRFVRVYRLTAGGELADATFAIDGGGIADAKRVWIKPGDVVSVEKTAREATRMFLAEAFRIQTGAHVYYRWGESY